MFENFVFQDIDYICPMKKRLIIFLFCFPIYLLSQENNFLGIEAQYRQGLLIAHRGSMHHLPEAHLYGAEVSIYYQTRGKSEYHKLLNFPKYGVSFLGTTIGNERIMGNLFGAYAFGDFPFVRGKKDELSGTFGAGLCYITRIYDPLKNPKDVAVSTHLNALVDLNLKYRHYFDKNWNVVMGLHLTHASNGASRVPNLGVNMVFASIGLGYQFKNIELKTKEVKIDLDKKWKFGLQGIFSFKQEYPIGGKLYPVGNLSFIVTKRFTNLSGIEIYADGFYKTTAFGSVRRAEMTNWNIMQAGMFGGYNLYLNKLRVLVGLGAYVYDKFLFDGRFYARLGFKYQVIKHLHVVLGLKSHWAKADYVEYGIGYTF
jgi:hypothetical protein